MECRHYHHVAIDVRSILVISIERTRCEQINLFPTSDTIGEHRVTLKTAILYQTMILDRLMLLPCMLNATWLNSRICSRRMFRLPFHAKRVLPAVGEMLRRAKISFLGVVRYHSRLECKHMSMVAKGNRIQPLQLACSYCAIYEREAVRSMPPGSERQ